MAQTRTESTDHSAANRVFISSLANLAADLNPGAAASRMQVVRCRVHYIATVMQVLRKYFNYYILIIVLLFLDHTG